MVLVDTSVWVEHLRRGNEKLKVCLEKGQVLCHPFIIGELACGNLQNRRAILDLLRALPQVTVAEHEEVFHLLNRHRLYGKGLGWIDIHLLASVLLCRSRLWTFDNKLDSVARDLRVNQ